MTIMKWDKLVLYYGTEITSYIPLQVNDTRVRGGGSHQQGTGRREKDSIYDYSNTAI